MNSRKETTKYKDSFTVQRPSTSLPVNHGNCAVLAEGSFQVSLQLTPLLGRIWESTAERNAIDAFEIKVDR